MNENKVNCLLYADDIVLLSETPQGLQKTIDLTEKYGGDLGLELNSKKTKSMVFTKSGKLSKNIFTVNKGELEEVKNYKYLGIQISSSGSMNVARTNLYASAVKAFYKLRKIIDLKNMKMKTVIRLFESLIEPILLYACEITNVFNVTNSVRENNLKVFDRIQRWEQEKLHLQFCKFILGVNSKTSNMAAYGELGRFPLFVKATKQTIKYYNRCLQSDQNSLINSPNP